jgi:diamine N-acetyltransferase
MNIRLRPTLEQDLDFVCSAEQNTENRPFVTVWSRDQHLASLSSGDLAHLIIEAADHDAVGYMILAGLAEANSNIELRRLVVTLKGKGYGRQALRLIKARAFETLEAHRLWLDVKEQNLRARQLYESEGFVVEGVLRECVKGEAGWESLIVMSILRDEYEESVKAVTCEYERLR